MCVDEFVVAVKCNKYMFVCDCQVCGVLGKATIVQQIQIYWSPHNTNTYIAQHMYAYVDYYEVSCMCVCKIMGGDELCGMSRCKESTFEMKEPTKNLFRTHYIFTTIPTKGISLDMHVYTWIIIVFANDIFNKQLIIRSRQTTIQTSAAKECFLCACGCSAWRSLH